MRDEKIRKALDAMCQEMDIEDMVILDSQAYDKSIVGISEDGRLIYDEEKMINELMEDDNCSYFEAVEWIEYNTLRALPYMGEKCPIIMGNSIERILEIYGEVEKNDDK